MIKIIIVMLAVAIIIPLVMFLYMFNYVTNYTHVYSAKERYVVLSNKLKDGKPSYDMYTRMRELNKVLRAYTEEIDVVLTGESTEVRAMYLLLRDHFFTKDLYKHNIIMDGSSCNTIQSIMFLKMNNMSGCTIITSDYHIFRTMLIAKKLDFLCRVVPARDTKVQFWKYFLESYFIIFTFIFPIVVCRAASKVRVQLHLK